MIHQHAANAAPCELAGMKKEKSTDAKTVDTFLLQQAILHSIAAKIP